MNIDNSFNTYQEKYNQGYGVIYPEGHVIRFYERFLKHERKMNGGKILDFGCGSGTHMKYFLDKGFEVFGVDIVDGAVKQARLKCGGGGKYIINSA